jgi:sulfur-oxidizing protein SoxX
LIQGRLYPDTMMPSYYRVDGLTASPPSGQAGADGQQIEDVVAYLITLRE